VTDTATAMEQLRRSSALLEVESSHDLQDAADALLERAAAAQASGDDDRARRLVQRAKGLGRDDHEGAETCSMAVQMGLFTLVADVLEEEDPFVWLEAAEVVLAAVGGVGREQLLDVLLVIGDDYRMDADERAVLRRLTRGAQRPASVFEGRDLEVDEVLQVLAVTTAYDDAVAELMGEP